VNRASLGSRVARRTDRRRRDAGKDVRVISITVAGMRNKLDAALNAILSALLVADEKQTAVSQLEAGAGSKTTYRADLKLSCT